MKNEISNKKILIIDDEDSVRRALQRVLSTEYIVKVATDGVEGKSIWESFNPDLVLLDVLMPNMTGPQLLGVINHGLKSKTVIVLMSAFTGEYNLEESQKLGCKYFISKPFANIFNVKEQVKEWLKYL